MAGNFGDLPLLPNGKIDYAKLVRPEEQIDIGPYFSREELAAMGQMEKSRYKNLMMNYEVMIRMGLPALLPDFMKGPEYRARMAERRERDDYKPSDSSDSDEEWTPTMNRQKAKATNPPSAVKLFDKKMKRAIKESQSYYKTSLPSKPKTTAPKRPVPKKRQKTEEIKEKTIKYNLRERLATNYMDLEVPDDDTFLYCEECNKEYDQDCPIHGALNWITDSETTAKDPEKAENSLPAGLVVKESGISGAGLGVWSSQEFPARTLFGPYGGEIVLNKENAHKSGYAWQIYKDRKPSHFIDAKDKSKSNWMRYVNCAASETEQNLVAFQYRGKIYYRSYKAIPAGTELLVWYGQEYARELGMIRDKNLLLVPKYINGEEIYICLYCKAAFGSAQYYVRHLLRQHACDKLDKDNIRILDKWLREQQSTNQTQLDKQQRSSVQTIQKITVKTKSDDNDAKVVNVPKKETSLVTSDKKHFKCDICCKAFATKCNQRIHTSERPYRCEACGKGFSQDVNLQTHQGVHTGDKPYKCETCGQAVAEASDLHKHQRTHTGERPYKCETCGKAFIQSSGLYTHQRTRTGERPYKCETCGKAFTQASNLYKHQRIHTGERHYKCETCGKAFTQASNLYQHQRTHTGERHYKCETCGKAFIRSSGLYQHQRTHTGERHYKCETCGKAFAQASGLYRHHRTHTGERHYKCETCGKAFIRSSGLYQHQRTHTGERHYKCETCGKAFAQASGLYRHHRTHTGERHYKCETCGKAFIRSSGLYQHQRTHTGERHYKCETCGKAFAQASSLYHHHRTHTGERPYKCETCGKAFTQACVLYQHHRTHTEERSYKCETCGKAFTQASGLCQHQRTHARASDLHKYHRIHTGERPYKM